MGIVNWLRVQWDRAAAVAAVLLGLLALLLGWIGTSDSLYVAQQLPYIISGGLLGIFLLIVGSVLWLSADLRDEWRELRALRELHAQHLPLAGQNAHPATSPEAVVELLEPATAPATAARAAGRVRSPRRPTLAARAISDGTDLS